MSAGAARRNMPQLQTGLHRVQTIRVLFNHRVDQNFARNAFHFRLRFGQRQRITQRDLEVLSLSNLFNTLILHLAQSAVNGLALRVQDGGAERNVDVCLHPPDYTGMWL